MNSGTRMKLSIAYHVGHKPFILIEWKSLVICLIKQRKDKIYVCNCYILIDRSKVLHGSWDIE